MKSLKLTVLRFWIAYFLSNVLYICQGQNSGPQPSITSVLDSLFRNYDSRIRPYYDEKPVTISVRMYLLPWFEVDERKSEFSTTVILIQNWTDPRLAYENLKKNVPYITLTKDQSERIWVPDTYVVNEKNSYKHEITVPNDFIKITPDGMVSKEQRVTITATCPFYLNQNFPFDAHDCFWKFASLSNPGGTEIQYKWAEDDSGEDAAVLVYNAKAVGFQVLRISKSEVTQEKAIKGIRLRIDIKRALGPVLNKLFIPMMMFVIISLLSLAHLPAKIAAIVNCLMVAFLNIFMALSFNGPDFHWGVGKTALDSYFNICFAFILICVVVNIINIWIEESKSKPNENIELHESRSQGQTRRLSETDTESTNLHFGSSSNFNQSKSKAYFSILMNKLRKLYGQIRTVLSFICKHAGSFFAVVFFLVNIQYFTQWMAMSGYRDNSTEDLEDLDFLDEY